jgi:hypothetical protein
MYFCNKKQDRFNALFDFVLKTIKADYDEFNSIITSRNIMYACLQIHKPDRNIHIFLMNELEAIFNFLGTPDQIDNPYPYITQQNIDSLLQKLNNYIRRVFNDKFFLIYENFQHIEKVPPRKRIAFIEKLEKDTFQFNSIMKHPIDNSFDVYIASDNDENCEDNSESSNNMNNESIDHIYEESGEAASIMDYEDEDLQSSDHFSSVPTIEKIHQQKEKGDVQQQALIIEIGQYFDI